MGSRAHQQQQQQQIQQQHYTQTQQQQQFGDSRALRASAASLGDMRHSIGSNDGIFFDGLDDDDEEEEEEEEINVDNEDNAATSSNHDLHHNSTAVSSTPSSTLPSSGAAAARPMQTPNGQPIIQVPPPALRWDDATIACLIRLRYVEMRRLFDASKSSVEAGEAWQSLLRELNVRTHKTFTSIQAQLKLKSFRQKWNETTQDAIAAGQQRKTSFVESLALLTELYKSKVVTPLKQMTERSTEKRKRRDRERRRARPASTDQDDNDDAALLPSIQWTDLTGATPTPTGPTMAGEPSTDAQPPLINHPRLALEREHLALFARQVAATEAMAQIAHARLDIARAKLHAAHEQITATRDQVELSVFALEPDPNDSVAREFVQLKRQQARDRVRAEYFAFRQRDNSPFGVAAASAASAASAIGAVRQAQHVEQQRPQQRRSSEAHE